MADKNANNPLMDQPTQLLAIRDIIFGTTMQEYEKRFSAFEEDVMKQRAELEGVLKNMQDQFQDSIKNLDTNTDERVKDNLSNINKVQSELTESRKELQSMLTEVNKTFAKSVKALEESLVKKVESNHKEVMAAIAKLEEKKSDKKALGKLFSDLGKELSK